MVACNPMEDDCHDPDPARSPSPTKPKNNNDDPPDPNPNGFRATGGGAKPLYMLSGQNQVTCPSGYVCISLTLAELTNLSNILAWVAGLEGALLGVAAGATLPEGFIVGAVAFWEVGDLVDIRDHIANAQMIAATNGSAKLMFNQDLLGDAYYFEGNATDTLVTAINARRIMNIVTSYHQVKHWVLNK